MAPASSNLGTPLSDNDFATLEDFLERHGRVDLDGLLGLLTAVAVAPGLVPPSAWIPEVLSDSPPETEGDARLGVGLVLRLYNEVVSALDQGAVILPEAKKTEDLAPFAKGYVDGALLDPEWTGDHDRWSFVSQFAYIAGERGLVLPEMLAQLDSFADARQVTREQASAIITEAHRSFKAHRSGATAPRSSPRIGRNDPCPCGSGKKSKKCCAAAANDG